MTEGVIEYLQKAGRRAIERSANMEAVLTRALELHARRKHLTIGEVSDFLLGLIEKQPGPDPGRSSFGAAQAQDCWQPHRGLALL